MPAPSARRLVLPPVWATTADGSFTATVVHADQCWAIEALAPGSRRTAAPELASLALDELVVRALRTGRYWGPGGLLAANDVADAVLIGKVRVLDDVVRHGLPEGDQLREWAVLQRLHDSSIVLAALSRRQYGESQTVMAYLARLVQLAQRKVAKEPTTMILPHGIELNLTYAVVPAIAQRGRPRTSLPPTPTAGGLAALADLEDPFQYLSDPPPPRLGALQDEGGLVRDYHRGLLATAAPTDQANGEVRELMQAMRQLTSTVQTMHAQQVQQGKLLEDLLSTLRATPGVPVAPTTPLAIVVRLPGRPGPSPRPSQAARVC
jgi:hypothetical protein